MTDAPDTICSAVARVRPWTKEEKNALRRIVTHCLRVWPSLARTYSQCQMSLVERGEAKGYDWQSIADFDCELIRLYNAGQADKAIELMADKLKTSMDEYYPDCPLLDYLQFAKEYSERRSAQTTAAAHPAI